MEKMPGKRTVDWRSTNLQTYDNNSITVKFWIPIPNTTTGIECPDLDDPKYGTVRVSGTTPGSRADYKCNAGFKLIGVASRKCQDNGQWTGQAPTCKRMIST